MTLARRIAGTLLRFMIMSVLLAIPILAQSSCINLGGDSCHGTAYDCHGQLCANAAKYGCTPGPGCFGPTCSGGGCFDSCAFDSEADCSTNPGCTWDPNPTSCIGARVDASCETMGNEDDCNGLSGCVWGTS
jgi:hypothetical protein